MRPCAGKSDWSKEKAEEKKQRRKSRFSSRKALGEEAVLTRQRTAGFGMTM
jgi:hypothetical protein